MVEEMKEQYEHMSEELREEYRKKITARFDAFKKTFKDSKVMYAAAIEDLLTSIGVSCL